MPSSGLRWVDIVVARLRSLFARKHIEREMENGIRFHFESLVDMYVARGLSSTEALRRARIESGFPEQIKDECRDTLGVSVLENLIKDVQFAVRGFLKTPVFTLAAIGAIALGVGVNTAIFSVFYAMILRPLPVKNAATLRNVYVATHGKGDRMFLGSLYFVSFDEFKYMRSHSRTAELAGISEAQVSWQSRKKTNIHAELVSDNLLPVIGARPVMGRFFSQRECASAGSAPVVVLS